MHDFSIFAQIFKSYMSNMNLSEQEQIRRQALDELRKLGINPYPAAEYKTNVFAQDILDNLTLKKIIFRMSALQEG